MKRKMDMVRSSLACASPMWHVFAMRVCEQLPFVQTCQWGEEEGASE